MSSKAEKPDVFRFRPFTQFPVLATDTYQLTEKHCTTRRGHLKN